jgi:cytochrome c553
MRQTISCLLITASTVLVWALLFSTHPRAQQPAGADPMVKRGEELYAQSCTAFCHGPGGAPGQQAPQLANRNFDEQYIERVITYGVPGTAMPAWGQRLIKEDLVPIMTYVKYLNGIAPPSATLRTLPREASTGRELFFDPTQELGACSNCHEFEGKGIGVAPITGVPANTAALRNLAGPSHMKTVTVAGEAFPGIVATELKDELHVYDLTTVPPSLRTLSRTGVSMRDGATWRHDAVLGKYTDQEMSAILAYLREMVHQ